MLFYEWNILIKKTELLLSLKYVKRVVKIVINVCIITKLIALFKTDMTFSKMGIKFEFIDKTPFRFK